MAMKPNKDDVLDRLLEVASERWGKSRVEALRPALEMLAEALYDVKRFRLELEEPAHPGTVVSQAKVW